MEHHSSTLISRLKEAIFARRPVLKEILMKYGHERLTEYTKRYHDILPNLAFHHRREEIFTIIREDVGRLLGPETADGVVAQLRHLPVISTADHHGPLVHPLFLNSNILFSLPFLEKPSSYLPVFAFSSVSLNNNSSYSRGLLFHDEQNGKLEMHRLPLFPDREKMCTVFGLRAYTSEDVKRLAHHVHRKKAEKTFTAAIAEKLHTILDTIFHAPHVLQHKTFSEQITAINHALWHKFFHGAQVPRFVAIDIEQLSVKALLRHHLSNPESIFYKMLFDADVRRLVWEYFCGIEGALQHDKGTHYFWALDAKHHRVSLFEKNGILSSREGTITVPLEPEAIITALKEGKIFPSMFFIYILFGLYYGFRCLGGFSQVNTMSQLKLAWRALLTNLNHTNEDIEAVRALDVRLMNDGFTVAYAAMNGTLVPAAALNLILHGDATALPAIQKTAERLTVTESFLPALPEIYRVLYSDQERNPELLSVTSEEIIRALGLHEKVVPCVTITQTEVSVTVIASVAKQS